MMYERPNLKQNRVFQSSSQTLPLMLDLFLVYIFLEVKNEFFLIKMRELKFNSHRRHHYFVLEPEIVIDVEVAMVCGFRRDGVGVNLHG